MTDIEYLRKTLVLHMAWGDKHKDNKDMTAEEISRGLVLRGVQAHLSPTKIGLFLKRNGCKKRAKRIMRAGAENHDYPTRKINTWRVRFIPMPLQHTEHCELGDNYKDCPACQANGV